MVLKTRRLKLIGLSVQDASRWDPVAQREYTGRMHELSVCKALLRQVDTVACTQGLAKVQVITLRIGSMSGVDPGLLARAFVHARLGTLASEAHLQIEEVAAQVHCPVCESDSIVRESNFTCSYCGNRETQLSAGTELLLVDLTGTPLPETIHA